MELTINETQAKELLKQVMIELVKEKRDLFFEIVVEAMEEIGLANAIREGRRNEYVSEEQITAILVLQRKVAQSRKPLERGFPV
jgi:hypothetical protein